MKRSHLTQLIVVSTLAIGLIALHQRFPLPYVARVMFDQGPDYYDFRDFPASLIEASRVASDLPVAPDERVAAILESTPNIGSIDDFIAATDTSAFLVIHAGTLIYERYGLGHTAESIENTFSVTKSITSALIGLAEQDGSLFLDAPITRYVPELGERESLFSEITIADLLNMRSGIRFSRDIAFPVVNNDDPLIYYFPDLESVLLERTEIAAPPGEFQYNNYNPPLLGLILRRATGMSPSANFQRNIWQPMGARWEAGWTTDAKGFERMESGFHARARDLARFGLLYLNYGSFENNQILPEEWVRRSTATPDKVEVDTYDGRRWGYQLGWWIVPRSQGVPDFAAIGHFGQFIYVSPQFDTVIIRNGPGRGNWGDRDWTQLFYSLAERLGRQG